MHPTPSALARLLHHGVRLLALPVLLTASVAYADDYGDINQLLRLGKYPEALTRADQYLAGKPRDPQMRFLKGIIQSESGKTSDAVATFAKLTDDFPELPEPYNNLAVIYANQGQYDKARIALEMAIRTNPSYATAQENLADVYARMASQAYNKALQVDPGNKAAAQPKLAMIHDLTSTHPSASASKTGASTSTHAAILAKSTAAVSSAPPALPVAAITAAKATTVAPAATPISTASTASTAPAATAAPATPAAAAAKPAPVASHSGAQKSVETAVRAWASAWAAKDMGNYLGAYDKSFTPPNKASRKDWEKERHARIVGKNNIDVKISDLAVTVKDHQATARFRQEYSAGKFKASSRKTLELVKSGDRWFIVSESTGG